MNTIAQFDISTFSMDSITSASQRLTNFVTVWYSVAATSGSFVRASEVARHLPSILCIANSLVIMSSFILKRNHTLIVCFLETNLCNPYQCDLQ